MEKWPMHWRRYSNAMIAMLIAVGVRAALIPVIGLVAPYLTVFPVLLLVAVTSGMGPSLLAGVMGVFATELLLIEPVGAWTISSSGIGRALLLLAGTGAVGFMAEKLRRSQEEAQDHAAAASAAEQQYRDLIDVLPAAVYLCDANGGVTLFNERAADLWGRRPLPGEGNWSGAVRCLRPDGTELKPEETPMARAVLEKRQVSGEEVLIERADGTRIFTHPYSKPVYDASGAIAGAVNVVIDTENQKKYERALEETSVQLHAILENAPTPIYSKDREGRYLLLNESWAKAAGISATDAVGRKDSELMEARAAEAIERTDRLVLEQKQVLQAEDRIPGEGGTRVFRSVKFPLAGREDEASGVCCISTDVTDQERTQQALRESEEKYRLLAADREQLLESERAARGDVEKASRLKDEFLGTVSHELRTPLNAILGWAQLLARNRVEPEKALPIIEQNARTQAQLIEDLLDMSRIVSGRLRVETRLVQLDDVAWASVNSVRPSAEEKGIGLEFSTEGGTSLVEADTARLQQIIWNLLSNAVKFTPRGGVVSVEVRGGQGVAEVRVMDTGEGIDPNFLPHIFDSFRQGDASTTRKHRGLGIGLAIASHLAGLHGGKIIAESKGIGCGSTFTLVLPRQNAEKGVEPSPGVGEQLMNISIPEGITILVIDDEPHAVDLLKHVLGERGAYVWTASSAREALGILERERPDLILSDIGMPEMDGYSFIRLVKAYPDERSTIPAIALTAFARGEDRARALEAGYAAHVTKPIDPAILLNAVAEVVNKRGEAIGHRDLQLSFDA